MRWIATPNRRKLLVVGAAGLALVPALAFAGAGVTGGDAVLEAKAFAGGAPSNAAGTLVTCPAGQRALGGGVGQTGPTSPPFAEIEQNGPVDAAGSTAETGTGDIARSWLVSVRTLPKATSRTHKAFAICSADSDATLQTKAFDVPAKKVADELVSCPSGQRVVGGGVGQTEPTGTLLTSVQQSGPLNASGSTANTSSGDIGRSWSASVSNRSDSVRHYKVFAVCSADSDATIQAKYFPVTIGDKGPVTVDEFVACPGEKSIAVGGGVGQTGPTSPAFAEIQQSNPLDTEGATETAQSGDRPHSWFVSVTGGPATEVSTRAYKVFAICATQAAVTPQPTTTTTTTTTTPTPKPGQLKVLCAGKQASIVGTIGADTLRGTAKADIIAGRAGNDTIAGLGGNDTICGGNGNDTVSGGPGDDSLLGEGGDDSIFGGPGTDSLSGGPGNDTLVGGLGLDRLNGGLGKNTLKP
jgi:Ca2+-binding RTX toxin-like protein